MPSPSGMPMERASQLSSGAGDRRKRWGEVGAGLQDDHVAVASGLTGGLPGR
jgi:hypothetical protein